jgi:hypothetical protein
VFYFNTDEKEIGLFPPSDNSRKIYVSRRWTSDHQESKPTFDQAVSHAVGNHYFLQWSKLNRTKTFFDKVTRTSSQAMSGKHHKNNVNCIRRNIMQEIIIKMMT